MHVSEPHPLAPRSSHDKICRVRLAGPLIGGEGLGSAAKTGKGTPRLVLSRELQWTDVEVSLRCRLRRMGSVCVSARSRNATGASDRAETSRFALIW